MDSLILDYGGALDYGVPAGTYYSDPAGEIAALTAKLETAEKENARIQDALIPKPLQPASVPHAYMLEEAARHANYWVEGARNAPDRTAAFICLHSSVNGWKNAAYAMAEKRMAAEGKITEQAAQIEALEKDAERYRWLRSNSVGPSQIWELLSDDCSPPVMTLKAMHDLDAAIDAAILGDSHV